MASKQEMEIIITPEGEVKIEVRGIEGAGCVPELERVAAALGEIQSTSLKPEYYTRPAATKVEKKRGG